MSIVNMLFYDKINQLAQSITRNHRILNHNPEKSSQTTRHNSNNPTTETITQLFN